MSEPRITAEAVRHVATLACISLTVDEQERMQRELDAILGFIAELDAVDVRDVPPFFEAQAPTGELRADVVLPSLDRAELLAAAPESDAGGFAVPKVLDGE